MPKLIAAPSIPTPANHSNFDSNPNAALGQPRGGPIPGNKPLFAPRVERLLQLIAEIERDSQDTRS
jgi:hypothetical protein